MKPILYDSIQSISYLLHILIMQQDIDDNRDQIDINALKSWNSSSTCGYCHGYGNLKWGFNKPDILPINYEILLERGWRRCGQYYYKPNIDKSCCKLWTHRLDVTKFDIKKDQKKSMRKFIKITHSLPPKHKSPQKHQTLSKHTPKLIQQHENVIIQVVTTLHTLINQRRQQFIGLFKERLLKIGQFSFEGVLQKLRCLGSKPCDKYDGYCNYLMIIFGNNKKLFEKQFNSVKFICLIDKWVENLYQKQIKLKDIGVKVQKSGYLLFNFGQMTKITKKQHSHNPKQPTILNYHQDQLQLLFDLPNNQIKIGHLTIKLQKPDLTDDNWQLYQRYCAQIHQKIQTSKLSFRRFLCLQSIVYHEQIVQSGDDQQFITTWDQKLKGRCLKGVIKRLMGCYHMNYYLKGKLIAVGVLDFVVNGVSSVYFFYEPSYRQYRLGVVSSIIEIEYIRKMQQYYDGFKHYYMGFYVQNCQKMSYKVDYEPCQLLCPITYRFVDFSPQLRKKIDKIQLKQIQSIILSQQSQQINPDMIFPENIEQFLHQNLAIKSKNQTLPLQTLKDKFPHYTHYLKQYIKLWGKQLANNFEITI